MPDQAPQTLEEHIPRCDIKDIHEFPDELKPGERCWNCVTWELIDAEREQARQEVWDEVERVLDITPDDVLNYHLKSAINAKRKKDR